MFYGSDLRVRSLLPLATNRSWVMDLLVNWKLRNALLPSVSCYQVEIQGCSLFRLGTNLGILLQPLFNTCMMGASAELRANLTFEMAKRTISSARNRMARCPRKIPRPPETIRGPRLPPEVPRPVARENGHENWRQVVLFL